MSLQAGCLWETLNKIHCQQVPTKCIGWPGKAIILYTDFPIHQPILPSNHCHQQMLSGMFFTSASTAHAM